MNNIIHTMNNIIHTTTTTTNNQIEASAWGVPANYKTPKYRVGEIVTFSYSAHSRPTFYMGKIIGAEFSDSCFWMYLITKGDSCPLSVPEEHIKEVIYINYQAVSNTP